MKTFWRVFWTCYLLLFVGIGAVCLTAGVWSYLNPDKVYASLEQDTATLTRWVRDSNPKSADDCPVYEFTDKSENRHSFIGQDCVANPDPNTVGKQKVVYIDPTQSPKIPLTIHTREEGVGNLVMGIVGFLFFAFLGLVTYVPLAIHHKLDSGGYVSRTRI
jgi:hypothetical protein